jgi:hypothetical protein
MSKVREFDDLPRVSPHVSYIRLLLSRVEVIKGIALFPKDDCHWANGRTIRRRVQLTHLNRSHSDMMQTRVLGRKRKAVNELKRSL